MKTPYPTRPARAAGAVLAAFIALAATALSACSATPPDIEFYCGKPAWTDNQGYSTIYSIRFETEAASIPWDCSAIVSFDLYDLDGYVHAVAAYVLDIEATVEPSGWDSPFFQRAQHTFTVDLEDIAASEPRGSASYTSRVRGVRAVVPRDVVFHPTNTLLHPAWWRVPFVPKESEGPITGYVANSR